MLQIPAGLAADKWSIRKLLPTSTSIIGIGGIIFAMMPSVEIGMLARAIMGAGGAFVFLPGLKIIYQWFKRSERGLAIGIYLTAPGVAGFVATGVLPFLLGLGWRYLYWVITIPVFIFASLAFCLLEILLIKLVWNPYQ
jgi:MFS family permease